VKSMAEATALNKTKPDVVAKIYAQFAGTGDDAAKLAVQQAQETVPIDMLPTADGIKAVQQVVAETLPSAGTADPTKYFDDQYIKRLEQQGFYKQLGA
jgi:ABC-type nitrate/sulfonate/bicarbonate transport system substrate-binding protein